MRMKPVLEARESLRRATEIAAGAGNLKSEARRRILNTWQKEARIRGKSSAQRIQRPDDMKIALATVGIGFEVVE